MWAAFKPSLFYQLGLGLGRQLPSAEGHKQSFVVCFPRPTLCLHLLCPLQFERRRTEGNICTESLTGFRFSGHSGFKVDFFSHKWFHGFVDMLPPPTHRGPPTASLHLAVPHQLLSSSTSGFLVVTAKSTSLLESPCLLVESFEGRTPFKLNQGWHFQHSIPIEREWSFFKCDTNSLLPASALDWRQQPPALRWLRHVWHHPSLFHNTWRYIPALLESTGLEIYHHHPHHYSEKYLQSSFIQYPFLIILWAQSKSDISRVCNWILILPLKILFFTWTFTLQFRYCILVPQSNVQFLLLSSRVNGT